MRKDHNNSFELSAYYMKSKMKFLWEASKGLIETGTEAFPKCACFVTFPTANLFNY